eukprot:CAMPEP_0114246076 /NCGR_PEP_ID=MMETSP0058-20121206/12254_1 /TAXON_ID=36894 /ORGANISM="Pyramimonas parkeae, CCMP726" /LENGTH=368 /DNA_ID=CAMNT_0001359207 /DNA_START=93 /DNA_END=1199 /DNA_ORIENTATION=+
MNDAFAAVSYALDASWLWDAGLSTVDPIESRPCNNAPKCVHTARTRSGTDSSSDSEKEDYTSSNEDRHGNLIGRDYVNHATDVQLGADMYVRRKELSPGAASRPPSLCLEAPASSILEEWELRSRSQFFNSALRPEEAPSTSGQDQWASHQERIRAYDLEEVLIVGDGNCQFRALAHQMFQSQERHLEVRRAVHAQLRRHPKRYKNHVPGVYKDYVEQMRQPGAWGDHVTLQAMADTYRVRIQIATPVDDQGMMEIAPYKRETRRLPVLWLSFWPEIHYNSLQPASLKADALRPVYLELPFPHQSNVIHHPSSGTIVWNSSSASLFRYRSRRKSESDFGKETSQPQLPRRASSDGTQFTLLNLSMFSE